MRRRHPLWTWALLAIFAASTAVAEMPCPSDCCDGEPSRVAAPEPPAKPDSPAAMSEHCAGMMAAEAGEAPSAAPLESGDPASDCGCHEITAAEGTDEAPMSVTSGPRVTPSAAALPLVQAPSLDLPHHGHPEADAPAGPTRAPPIFLLNASFLN